MVTPQRKRFGKWIRALRHKVQLPQLSVAEKLGYDGAQFVSNWERGMSLPPAHVQTKLARVLGIPYRALADEIYAVKQRELAAAHKAAMKGK